MLGRGPKETQSRAHHYRGITQNQLGYCAVYASNIILGANRTALTEAQSDSSGWGRLAGAFGALST